MKSMLGESLGSTLVTSGGVIGDRTYAVRDPATGRVLSTKREAELFSCSARLADANGAVTVTLPGGRELRIDDRALELELSQLLGRPVGIARVGQDRKARVEIGETSATTEGPASEFSALPGTFFDSAEIHIVTTSSLAALRALTPESEIDGRRFRPNFVVSVGSDVDFVEERWVGRQVLIGADLVLEVLKPCSRCVMVTLPQEELARDKSILQTVARRNDNNLGVLAKVIEGGRVEVGDELRVV